MSILSDDSVLVRRLDVTTRITDQVTSLSENANGGLLLETLIGRFVLNSDGRKVFLAIDGSRSQQQVVEAVAQRTGLPADEIRQPVQDLCERLLDLELVEAAGAPVAVSG
jgi:hypothetical protein